MLAVPFVYLGHYLKKKKKTAKRIGGQKKKKKSQKKRKKGSKVFEREKSVGHNNVIEAIVK